jgi:hypothetical protein
MLAESKSSPMTRRTWFDSETRCGVGSLVMRRDELINALRDQATNTDVQISIVGYLIDVDAVVFTVERDAIVLRVRADDLRDAIGHVVKERKWWRGSQPGGLDDQAPAPLSEPET